MTATLSIRADALIRNNGLFLVPWHVVAQDLVDARLPALPFPAVCFQHIRIDAKRLVHLAVFLWRTAGTAANLLAYFPPGHVVTALVRFDRLRGTEWAATGKVRLCLPDPAALVPLPPSDGGKPAA